MPNSAETIRELTQKLERQVILALAKESESLQEFISKLETIIQSDN